MGFTFASTFSNENYVNKSSELISNGMFPHDQYQLPVSTDLFSIRENLDKQDSPRRVSPRTQIVFKSSNYLPQVYKTNQAKNLTPIIISGGSMTPKILA